MKELYKQFKKLKNDKQRWEWILANQDKGITIMLDNDETFGVFKDDEDGDYVLDFDNYIGWANGLEILLKVVGIKADCV